MSSVDDRIVNMQFNSKQFTSGVSDTQKSLAGLEKALASMGKGADFKNIEKDVSNINKRFSIMGVVGATAIAKITSATMGAGKNMIANLIGPLKAGGLERALNIEQAKFQFSGLGMNIEKSMASALEAVKGTAYGLDSAAKLASQFGASGMKAGQEMTDALRGVAGASAMTNTSFDEIGQIFKSIAGEGKVSAVRMEQFGTRGLNAWSALAKGMGKSETEIREMVKNREIDFKTFAATMNDAFGEHATSANKTYAGSLSNVKAAMSRVGASFATAKIENQRKMFNALTPVIDNLHSAFGPLIKSYEMWTNVGRRNVNRFLKPLGDADNNPFEKYSKSIENVSRMFVVLRKIVSMSLRNIIEAFSDVFGGGGGMILSMFENVSGAVLTFLRVIKDGLRDGVGIKPFFVAIFSVLKVGMAILGGIGMGFVSLFKALVGGGSAASSGIMELVSGVGEAINAFANWLVEGDRLTSFFEKIGSTVGNFINPVIEGVGLLVKAFAALFSGGGIKGFMEPLRGAGGAFSQFVSLVAGGLAKISAPFEGLSGVFEKVRSKAEGLRSGFKSLSEAAANEAQESTAELASAGRSAATGWERLSNVMSTIGGAIKTVFGALADAGSWAKRQFQELFSGMEAIEFASLMNALFTGATILAIRSFTKGLKDSLLGIGLSIQDTFGQLTDTLKTMQQEVKAKMIQAIAIAVALLTASVIALTFVDVKKLAISLGAIAAMLGMLTGTLAILSRISSDFQMAVLATSIMLISMAMLNLAMAVTIFGQQDPKKVAVGLAAMAISLGILVGAIFAFSKIKGSIEGMAASMLVMAIAMNALALAVLAFGKMNMKTLAKGFGSMAVGLGLMVAAMLGFDRMKGSVEGMAGSIFIISAAMVVMATAVAIFGNMDMETLAKGFTAMAIGMGIMVGAILVLSGNSAGVLAASTGMVLMATAMNMLVGVVLTLGLAPWEVIAQGLGFVAAGLAIFLAAGLAAMVVAPGLLALGVTVTLLGVGLALAGAGMFAFASGLAILTALGTASVAVIVAAIQTFMAMLPSIAVQVAAAFVAFLKVIANASPKIRKEMGTIFSNMIGVVRDAIPELRKLIQDLIDNAIQIIEDSASRWAEAGFTIIDNFLASAADHAPNIIESVVTLIETFLTGIENNAGRVMDQAAKTIIAFIDGVANAVDNNSEALRASGRNLARAIIDGITGGLLTDGMAAVRSAASSIAGALPKWMKKVLGIASPSKVTRKIGRQTAQGLSMGITDGIKRAVAAAARMANAVIAEGSKAVAKAQAIASKARGKADRDLARANVTDKKARKAEREAAKFARKNPKAEKAIAARDRAAAALRKKADNQLIKADRSLQRAEKADERVRYRKDFEAADTLNKGIMKQGEAVDLAGQARRKLAEANAEAAEARRVMKTNRKLGRSMLKAARNDAKQARKLAAQAQAAKRDAEKYYHAEVAARLQQLKEDAELEGAEGVDKAKILETRAKANELRAEAQRKAADALMKAAESAMATDAAKALRLVEQAEAAAAEAKAAAELAEQQKQQAEQERNAGITDDPTGGTGGTVSAPITPSRSILEDAARSVDRYTASMRQASELAAGQAPVVQYVQHNHSPEALSASEIYRQSKNLLAFAEVKMGSS